MAYAQPDQARDYMLGARASAVKPFDDDDYAMKGMLDESGSDDEDSDGGDSPGAMNAMFMCLIGACCCLPIWGITMAVRYAFTHWECDPTAPPSQYGEDLFPLGITLDETANKALGWFGGARVDVLAGVNPAERQSMAFLGYFCEVWTWSLFTKSFGYIEAHAGGEFLRFTAKKSSFKFFWQTSPWTIEHCQPTAQQYQIERTNWWDGTFHNIYRKQSGSSARSLVGTADHLMGGLDVGASLFNGVNMNVQWTVAYKTSPTGVLVAEARQWYDHNMLIDYGSSNWAIRRTSNSSIAGLPGDVVAFTGALYDMTVGSDRRRRSDSDSGLNDGRRRGMHHRSHSFGSPRRRTDYRRRR